MLANAIRELTGKEYDALTQGQKIEAFNEISKITYKTIVTDLIKGNNDGGFSNFLVEPVKFGNGYRIITSGITNVEEFTTDPRQRYPQTRKLLEDYESTITDKTQLRLRITINEAETTFYFQTLEKMESFLNVMRKRISDTLNLTFQQSMIRFFGDGTFNIDTIAKDSSFITLLDNCRKAFKNTIQIKSDGSIKNVVKQLSKFVQNITSMTTSKFNCGYDGQDTNFKKAYNDVSINDLVLIMSNEDLVDYNTEIQATVYNNQYFQLPKLKIMALPIKSGTYWLIDKNALQIAPNRSVSYTDFYPNTLDFDYFRHEWFYMGVYPNAFGVKIEFVGGGKEIQELFENTDTNPISSRKK